MIFDPHFIARLLPELLQGAVVTVELAVLTMLICLAWGIFLQRFTWLGLLLVLVTTALLFITAWREEQESLEHFGDAYRDYMRGTRRFVPFLI